MNNQDVPLKHAKPTRRTRIVCISDTHNCAEVKIPKGDVLIHAGDLTNQGSYSEVRAWSATLTTMLTIIIIKTALQSSSVAGEAGL